MWRRYGDALYALVVLGGFTLQAVALAALTWSFVAARTGLFPGPGPEAALVFAVALAGVVLIALVGFVLVYHALSARREERSLARVAAWTDRWVAVALGEEPPSAGPLAPEAIQALLNVGGSLQGKEARALDRLLQDPSVAERLVRRLRSRNLGARLDALETLARAGLPSTFSETLRLMKASQPAVQAMAARATARALARFPEGPERERNQVAMADALREARLPRGDCLEALVLLDEAAGGVIRRVLESRETPTADPPDEAALLVRAGLEAAGWLHLLDLGETIGGFVSDPDSEVRATALRALNRLGYLPTLGEWALLLATHDRVEFVRTQAARACVLLPEESANPRLWQLLGDRSWWVRKAAAEALFRRGIQGVETLDRAARTHPDRYARHMAVQVLLDGKRIDSDVARRLQEVA